MDCCAAELLDATYVRALQRRADAYLSMGDWQGQCNRIRILALVHFFQILVYYYARFNQTELKYSRDAS